MSSDFAPAHIGENVTTGTNSGVSHTPAGQITSGEPSPVGTSRRGCWRTPIVGHQCARLTLNRACVYWQHFSVRSQQEGESCCHPCVSCWTERGGNPCRTLTSHAITR